MKNIVLGLALLGGAAIPGFAADESLFLTAGTPATTCTIDVTAGTPTSTGAGCAGLTAHYNVLNPGDTHGQIFVSGTIGVFTISTTANGYQFDVFPDVQDFTQSDVTTNAGGGTFNSVFTDFHVPYSVVTFSVDAGGSFGTSGNPIGSVEYTGLQNGSNIFTPFTLNTATPHKGPFTTPAPVMAGMTNISAGQNFTFTKKGNIQTSYKLAVATAGVPEPASIILTGSMLLLTGVGIRRKYKRS